MEDASLATELDAARLELAAARAELDAFRYSVSHDLRAPLRAIAGFAGLLAEDHLDALAPEARRYVEMIVASAAELDSMLAAIAEREARAPAAALSPAALSPAERASAPSSSADASVVVVEDDPRLRELLIRSLAAHGAPVVGAAADAESAVALIERWPEAVVVADLGLPGIGGLELAERLPALGAGPLVIYTGSDDPAVLRRALASPARGLASKASPLAELVEAVRIVAAGGRYLDPRFADLAGDPASCARPHPDG